MNHEPIALPGNDPWARHSVPEWLRPEVAAAARRVPTSVLRVLGKHFKGGFHRPSLIVQRLALQTQGFAWLPRFLMDVLRDINETAPVVNALGLETLRRELPSLCAAAGPGPVALALWLDRRPEWSALATPDLMSQPALDSGAPFRAAWETFVRIHILAPTGMALPTMAEPSEAHALTPEKAEELRRRVREAEQDLARERTARRDEVRALNEKVAGLNQRLADAAAAMERSQAVLERRIAEAIACDRLERMKPWMARAIAVEESIEALDGSQSLEHVVARARAALHRQSASDPHAANVARLRDEVRLLEAQRDEVRLALECALHRSPDLEEALRQLDRALVERRAILGEPPAPQPWIQDLAVQVATAPAVEALAALQARIAAMEGHGLLSPQAGDWLRKRAAERRSVLDEPNIGLSAPKAVKLMDVIKGHAPGRILVDACNWIGQSGDALGVSRDPAQFAQSLRRLEPWMRRLGEAARLADIRFVMDGPRAAHQTLGPTVRVEWTGGQGENRADRVIEGMLRVSDMSMPTWVITRDTDLGRRAREAGAVVEAPEAFTRRALAAGVKADTVVGGGGGPRR